MRPTTSLCGLVVLAAAALSWAGSAVEPPPVPAVVPAKDDEVKSITQAIEKANTDKDSELLAAAYEPMEKLRHESFVPLIRTGMKSDDAAVQAAAIRAAASHDLKDVEKDVRKLLHGKSKKEAGPSGPVRAAAIDYLARMGFGGEEQIILEEHLTPVMTDEKRVRSSWAKDMLRASIHYFGKFKYKPAVPLLVDLVAQPEPRPKDPKNPPATYWEARTKIWNQCEGWIRWALKEITGEQFQSSREWSAWLEANKKKFEK